MPRRHTLRQCATMGGPADVSTQPNPGRQSLFPLGQLPPSPTAPTGPQSVNSATVALAHVWHPSPAAQPDAPAAVTGLHAKLHSLALVPVSVSRQCALLFGSAVAPALTAGCVQSVSATQNMWHVLIVVVPPAPTHSSPLMQSSALAAPHGAPFGTVPALTQVLPVPS